MEVVDPDRVKKIDEIQEFLMSGENQADESKNAGKLFKFKYKYL